MLYKVNPNGLADCEDYMAESYNNFLLTHLKKGETIPIRNYEFNFIIIILEGKLLIECNEFINTEFAEKQIVFVPAYTNVHIEATDTSKVLMGTFELPTDVYTTKMMESLWELRLNMAYDFISLPVNPPMQQFIDLLTMYIENGMQCDRLHEIKEKEMFLTLRYFYSDEDFARLFYHIIGKSLDFRSLIIKNYSKVNSVGELANIANMSRSSFDSKFKAVFNMSPKQWMLKRKARSIRYYMSKPNITISDIMIKYGFDSFTHFNRFCKQHFGAAPSELLKDQMNSGGDAKL